MTGPAVALGLLVGGVAALFGVLRLIAPTGMRGHPSTPTVSKIVGNEFNTIRGGHVRPIAISQDPQEYAQIWSDDRT